jgi:hypothetical protein
MKVGDLVWSRWQEDCIGIIIDVLYDDKGMEFSYRVKWWWTNCNRLGESREYGEDLVTKEEKCK